MNRRTLAYGWVIIASALILLSAIQLLAGGFQWQFVLLIAVSVLMIVRDVPHLLRKGGDRG
jgi:hypothetical protein